MNPKFHHSTALTARFSTWLVVVLLLALTVALVNRFPSATRYTTTTISAENSSPMWQHLDRDAIHWAKPELVLTALQPHAFYPLVSPAGQPAVALLLDESLYNRPPPPSC
jgi:hypothetical protein